MQRVVAVDYENWQITVEAGIRLKHLIDALDDRGMALSNIGSVAEQSIAGAVGTGTHGSGLAYGSLSTQLVRFRLVTGAGEVVEVSRDDTPDLFHAAAVSFGSLGIMTEVTLQVEPTYNLREQSFTLSFEEAVRRAPDLCREHPRLKFWWLPHTGSVQVYTFEETDEAARPISTLAERYDRFMNDRVFTAILGVGRRFPHLVPRLNKLVGTTYFKPYTRVDRWDRILTVAMPPVHLENEYGLDVGRTAEMMRRVKGLIDGRRLNVGFVNEIRFVQGDDNWLSPAYGRDSVQFGAYTPDGRDARAYLEGVEDIAYDLGGRPHWGKDFHAEPAQLRQIYPRYDDFAALRRELDPDGVFVNDFVRRVFGLS
jgi:FAD-linked oxidoreductase